MKYTDVRDKLTTGSIVLFRGKGFFSDVILWFCSIFSRKKTRFSHVGMIVVDTVAHEDRVMLFESTRLNGTNGVQLNFYSDVVKNYKGKMWVRVLHADLMPSQRVVLHQFISDNLKKPYEEHLWELVAAACHWSIFPDNNSDWFCSELVARIYQIWGFIPKIPAAKTYSPESFGYNGDVDRELLTNTNAWLDEEIEVK